jgi:hypothetical protein
MLYLCSTSALPNTASIGIPEGRGVHTKAETIKYHKAISKKPSTLQTTNLMKQATMQESLLPHQHVLTQSAARHENGHTVDLRA